jgi:hypothetical protein
MPGTPRPAHDAFGSGVRSLCTTRGRPQAAEPDAEANRRPPGLVSRGAKVTEAGGGSLAHLFDYDANVSAKVEQSAGITAQQMSRPH